MLCNDCGADCGWTESVRVFPVVNDRIGIAACLEELAHFLCFFTEIGIIGTKTPQSK